MSITVHLALAGSRHVTVRASALSQASYYAFQDAVGGITKYVRDLRTKAAPLDQVPVLLQRLRAARDNAGEAFFDVELAPDVAPSLTHATGDDWLNLYATRDRIVKVDEELFARTGYRLFPFQRTGCEWLTLRKDALLADDQGLGKTLQCVVAFPAGAPVVVVCPSAAKGAWEGEIEKWRPQIAHTVLSGRKSFRWPKPGEILITNYDILPGVHDWAKCDGFLPPVPCPGCKDELGVDLVVRKTAHLATCKGFLKREFCPGCGPVLKSMLPGTVIVADEAQKLKNNKSQRSRAFRALAKGVRDAEGRRWLLSGTPLENDPMELWTVLGMAELDVPAFGSWKEFKETFKATPKSHGFGGYDFQLPDEADMRERLRRVSLRRKKADVLPELPPKTYQTVKVSLKREQLAKCEAFLTKHGGVAKFVESLSKERIKFEEMSAVRAMLAAAKIPAMLEFVEEEEERGEPFLVFSAHRAPIDVLGLRPGWAVLTGNTNDKGKKQVVADFQAGKLKGLAVMIQAGGTAITLTRAAFSLFVDRLWNPKANAQAEDRIHRIGQKRGVRIIDLVAKHPLDERLWQVVTEKERMFDRTVDASRVDGSAEMDTERKAALNALQAELHAGNAARRGPETDGERDVLEALHTYLFESPVEERLAVQLAEEGVSLGLTTAQWILAANVVTKGRTRAEAVSVSQDAGKESERPAEIPSEEFMQGSREGETNMGRQSEKEPVVESHEESADSEEPMGPEELRREGLLTIISSLTKEERGVLFEEVHATWCTSCGDDLDGEGTCKECDAAPASLPAGRSRE